MDFSLQLSAYYGDTSYGAARLYGDLIAQAKLADRLGYESIGLTEHHLVNVLLNPAPLQMAVRIAAETQNINILTCVVVLPIHDMRVYAGEVVVADTLCEGRLYLGVGRGAFAYEIERLGVAMKDAREIFDESLDLLQKLLTEENVSWKGKYYNFEPLTIMPRPMRDIPIMMAVLNPEAIYHCTKRGFHIQTTPLSGDNDHMIAQINGFKRGKQEMGEAGKDLTLTLSRVAFLVENQKEHDIVLDQAYEYYKRFDNVFKGPGTVSNGAIEPLPRKQSKEELDENLLICTKEEMIEKLSYYAEHNVDRILLNPVFGMPQARTLETIEAIAKDIIPALQ